MLQKECQYVTNPNPDTQLAWLQSQQQYASVAIQKAENKSFFLQQPYFEEEEGTAHLLATIVKAQRPSMYVSKMQTTLNNIVFGTPEIVYVFCEFFQTLHSSKVSYAVEDLTKFLDTINLPTFSDENRTALESTLTLDELRHAADMLPVVPWGRGQDGTTGSLSA